MDWIEQVRERHRTGERRGERKKTSVCLSIDMEVSVTDKQQTSRGVRMNVTKG